MIDKITNVEDDTSARLTQNPCYVPFLYWVVSELENDSSSATG